MRFAFLLSFALSVLCFGVAHAEQTRGVAAPTVTVCFVPGEDCTSRVVQVINEAKKQILIQAYGFTSTPILAAVKAAAGRGVEVLVILDKSNDRGRYSAATYLTNADIPVWIDTTPGIAHNKVMVVDRQITITGSFNFTTSAQKRNAENLLVISSRPVALRFAENWDARLKAAKAYGGLSDSANSAVDTQLGPLANSTVSDKFPPK